MLEFPLVNQFFFICFDEFFFLGEDGPSQMALEDFAMFRSVPTATCFYPSDAVSTERAIELAAQTKGISFTRTTRPATPVIYKNDEKFEIGKGKVRECNGWVHFDYFNS